MTKCKHAKVSLFIQLTKKINHKKSHFLKTSKICSHLFGEKRETRNRKDQKMLPTEVLSSRKASEHLCSHQHRQGQDHFANSLQPCSEVLLCQHFNASPPFCFHTQRTFLNSVLQCCCPYAKPATSRVPSDNTEGDCFSTEHREIIFLIIAKRKPANI